MFYKIRNFIRKHFIGYRPSDMPCIDYLESKGVEKMKIIDLLNKIANGEEVPKKIKYNNETFTIREEKDDYTNQNNWFTDRFSFLELNEEVEIIEDKPFSERVEEIYNRHIDYIYNEENKKIEKIPYMFNLGYIDMNDKDIVKKELNETINGIYNKINEIIDVINRGD